MKNEPCWPFADPQNVAAFTSTHIFRDNHPILYVSHDNDDGSWQFHWGGNIATNDAMIVTLEEVFEYDQSIAELADLPCGWSADRSALGQPWIRRLLTNV